MLWNHQEPEERGLPACDMIKGGHSSLSADRLLCPPFILDCRNIHSCSIIFSYFSEQWKASV